jgi:hypothetical protein
MVQLPWEQPAGAKGLQMAGPARQHHSLAERNLMTAFNSASTAGVVYEEEGVMYLSLANRTQPAFNSSTSPTVLFL